jgi:hypothetical protein
VGEACRPQLDIVSYCMLFGKLTIGCLLIKPSGITFTHSLFLPIVKSSVISFRIRCLLDRSKSASQDLLHSLLSDS